ncbi:MAG TPA: cytochrome c oxidase assembly protein [Ktedonobacterales bacterium]
MPATASHILLTGWNFNPSVVLGILALAGLYAYGTGPLRVRRALGQPVPRARAIAFYLGLGVLAFALLSPLDELGDRYLFSMHMVQHMLLVMVVPPLLLLGTPGWLIAPPLRRAGLLALARRLNGLLRGLLLPIIFFALFNVDFWAWHIPPLYDLTLRNESVHILEHLTFLIFATLNWLPILSPLPDDLPRLPRMAQVLYLFVSCQPMVLLGALLTFAAQPLYAPYVAAPRIFGLAPMADQQLGGLIMWIPGNLVYLLVMSLIFFQWVQHQSDETLRAEWEEDHADELASGSPLHRGGEGLGEGSASASPAPAHGEGGLGAVEAASTLERSNT